MIPEKYEIVLHCFMVLMKKINFLQFVKAQRQDNFGIPPLKHHGMLHTDSKTEAQIMLDEFTSVFTCEDTFSIPRVEGQSYPDIYHAAST